MSHKETDKHLVRGDLQSPAMQFFREESIGGLGLEQNRRSSGEELTFTSAEKRPVLPKAAKISEQEMNTYWRRLRNFFRSGKRISIEGKEQLLSVYPLLLAPYREHTSWPGPYPLWLAGAHTTDPSIEALFLPFMDLIEKGIQSFAPQDGAAKILKDNLPRLERILRHKVAFADIAYEAFPVLEESLQELTSALNISGPEGQTLAQDVKRLIGAMPKTGTLVPNGTMAPFHLLAAFLETHRQKERQELQTEIVGLIARLNELLAVERDKDPEAQSSGHLHDTLDFADHFLNFEELSSVLPASSSDAMPEERLHRIEKILKTLQNAGQELLIKRASLLIDPAIDDPVWRQAFSRNMIYPAKPERLCQQVMALYDERMVVYARIFAAIRLAKLELEDSYRSELHGDFFAHFDWRSFSDKELAVSPPVFLLADDAMLLNKELDDFSRLLASNRLIKLLVLKRTVHPEDGESGEALPEELMSKRELGALAIAHRQVCVVQTTIVDPLFLLEGLQEGLAAVSPVVFYVFVPHGSADTHYLRTTAAGEGRFFPSLLYNSERGPRWGSRFNIGQNPQMESDWPEHLVEVKEEGAQTSQWRLPFTFADFVAQEASFAKYFQLIPPQYWQDSLIPIAEYLQLAPGITFDKVPFIWLLDEQGVLQKAAVAWPLVLSCRERLDYWRYLQENAGIHSYHVEIATEKLKLEIEEEYERKKAAMQELHQQEVQKTAEEAARGAMERLAANLLEMDLDLDLIGAAAPIAKPGAIISRQEPKPSPTRKMSTSEQEKTQAAPVEKEEEELLPPGEAWIDTPLCTSCNECTDLNKKIFQYDENKQAFVADPKGGPFADIVKAAENCPVRIIHPGAPQDPKEANLDAFIKRAEPFN